MSSSKLNLLKSYQYNHLKFNVDNDYFTRLEGITRIFMGRVGNPSTENEIGAIKEGRNHFGVYDLITLGIPYLVESFCRGNMFANKGSRGGWILLGLILGWSYIALALCLVRFAVGAACAILLSPFVGIYHVIKTALVKHSKPPILEPQVNPNDIKKEALEYFNNFNKNYLKIVEDFKKAPNPDAASEEWVSWKTKTEKHFSKANSAYRRFEEVQPPYYEDATYQQRKRNLFFTNQGENGIIGPKYGLDRFLQHSGPGT